MSQRRDAVYRCSFCQKAQWQVSRLIGGPDSVYICNECVDLCGEIIAEELAAPDARSEGDGQDTTMPAELAAAHAAIERLVRENGALLERVRTLEAERG